MTWKKRCSYKQLFWKLPREVFSQGSWKTSLGKFVFSKVALSRPRRFLPKISQISLLGKHLRERDWKLQTVSLQLYWKWTSSWVFFKDFDCKFQNTYFPEHLLTSYFCRGIFRTFSRWSFFVNIMNGLKPLTIFIEKFHLRCFTGFCVRLCSEVTSSIYQTYKFKVYCDSFWRHCNVLNFVSSHIKDTLCPLSDVTLSKDLELLCDFMFATNTKTIIYVT